MKTAMAGKKGEITLNHAEEESQSKAGDDGEADNAGVGPPPNRAHRTMVTATMTSYIPIKMEAAKREKKWLSDQIRLKKCSC